MSDLDDLLRSSGRAYRDAAGSVADDRGDLDRRATRQRRAQRARRGAAAAVAVVALVAVVRIPGDDASRRLDVGTDTTTTAPAPASTAAPSPRFAGAVTPTGIGGVALGTPMAPALEAATHYFGNPPVLMTTSDEFDFYELRSGEYSHVMLYIERDAPGGPSLWGFQLGIDGEVPPAVRRPEITTWWGGGPGMSVREARSLAAAAGQPDPLSLHVPPVAGATIQIRFNPDRTERFRHLPEDDRPVDGILVTPTG